MSDSELIIRILTTAFYSFVAAVVIACIISRNDTPEGRA